MHHRIPTLALALGFVLTGAARSNADSTLARGDEVGSSVVAGPVVDADDTWVSELLLSDAVLADLAASADALRLQIVVGEIRRSEHGVDVHFHPYRLSEDYVYPASAIKTLGALAALRTLSELRVAHPEMTLDTPIRFDHLALDVSDGSGEPIVVSDRAETTLRVELERTLVVSSNEGFNRLWDFAGHASMNQVAWDAGLDSVRMHHRLSRQGHPEEAHRASPSVSAQIDGVWREILPSRHSGLEVPDNAQSDILVGTSYLDPATERPVDGPFDFGRKNSASLIDLLSLVAAVADHDLAPWVALGLDDPTVGLLREIMGRVPEQPSRFKPFSPGLVEEGEWDRWTYINKAGRAYGFHLDAAYVRDESTGVEFLLAASIHANPNGVINDSRYAYDELSFPFLVSLADAVFERLSR